MTGAAERLHVSQPALSKRIRALERQLGATLLERQPRGVALTEAGRAVLPAARDALVAWDAGQASLRELTAMRSSWSGCRPRSARAAARGARSVPRTARRGSPRCGW